jgi:Amt family ammonium transporter
VAVLAVGAYAFAVTYGLGKGIDRLMGFRAPEEHERTGLDLTVHAETAYDHGVLTHGMSHGAASVHAAVREPHDRSPLG